MSLIAVCGPCTEAQSAWYGLNRVPVINSTDKYDTVIFVES